MCIVRFFPWYGGKIRLVTKISFLMPEHRAYYEPFMGSAAVLLNHARSELEVINDLDPDLVCLMKTMADREKGKELSDRLCKLWYGKEFYEEAMLCQKKHYKGMSDIDRAVMVYIQITQSFNSTRKSFRKGVSTQDYRAQIQLHIPKVYERMRDVRVLNMNGIDVLERISENDSAFAFVDPPYRKELRGEGAGNVYACELPHREQVRLLKTIREAKCKIMLCGYRAEKGADLYDTYLLPYGWKCYKLADVVKACQTTNKKDIGHEFIWVNYELPEFSKYVISMKEYGRIENEKNKI